MESGGKTSHTGVFCCTLCNVKFQYKSKLERHLQSEDHQLFAKSIQTIPEDDNVTVDMDMDMDCQHVHYERGVDDTVSKDVDVLSTAGSEQEDQSDLDLDLMLDEAANSDRGDYDPFPTKIFSLLFALLHSPRPMGESNLRFIWFLLRKCGLPIPGFSTVKSFKLPGMVPPSELQTPTGIPFYMNTISSTLKRCIGNPHISQLLQRYPVVTSGPYREMFHALRWHNDSRFQSPMAKLNDGTHAFVNDCIRCKHPQFEFVSCIIKRFFNKDCLAELYAEVLVLLTLEQYKVAVPDSMVQYISYGTLIMFELVQVPLCDLVTKCQAPLSLLKYDHSLQRLVRMNEQEYACCVQPHPLKDKAYGKPVFMVPLVLFSDDTSGNKSKKWHKFDSWSFVLAGLPRHENAKISNLHFCCCSDTASAMDMSGAIADELRILEIDGLEAFDAHLMQDVLIVAPLMCIIADNPRASEILNHLGGSARRYCRMCMVDKEVSPTEIADKRNLVSTNEQIDEIKAKCSEKEKAALRTRYGIRETPNPLLSIPADLFRSTPIETLHTVLLGPYKYLLKCTIPTLSSRQKDELLARIRAFNYCGFRVRMIGNVVRYHQSFVGRDFKALAQMAPFILFPYLDEGKRLVWLALSKIFKIAYCDYYDPTCFAEWSQICREFVELVAQYQPEMLKKQKVHLLLHLVECMQCFGPTSSFNSERFEAFNSYIRVQNIYGNKHAPSRDIAHKFGVIEHMRYICEDGTLPGDQRCGTALKTLFMSPALQRFLYCIPLCETHPDKAIYQPGTLRKEYRGHVIQLCDIMVALPDPIVSLKELSSSNESYFLHLDCLTYSDCVQQFGGVISQNGDLIKDGDFLELVSPCYEVKFGLLLTSFKKDNGSCFCFIRSLETVSTPDGTPVTNESNCPLLLLGRDIFVTLPSNLLKVVSVVHECGETCCFENTSSIRKVERQNITISRLEYKHDFKTNLMYCLNIFCIGTC